MSIINYFIEKHIERCKKELEDFENNQFKYVREDLIVETRKYLEGINNFLTAINIESFTDLNGFNKKIKTFNDELNRIMKASANISPLVYVIQNIDEDEYYTYTNFISYFIYDENKFNDIIEIDIKYLKRLDKLLEESDDDFEVYKERGDLRAKLGFYNDAIDDYKKALELNPNYKEADKALTDTKNNLDIYNNSLINKDYTKDPMYYFSKAHNLYNKSKYEEAIKNYNKSIDLDPNNSYAYNNRGLAKNNLEQYFNALKDYDKAIELDPNNSVIYYNRGVAKTHLWQYEEAIEDYNKAIELDHNNSTAYYNRGLVKSYLGQYKEAIEDYNKTIELDPNNSHAYNNRGNAKDDLGRYKEAIKDYDKAIELNPNDRAAYHNRGLVKNYLRQYEEAMKDYDKAIELGPNNTDVYNYYNRGVIKRSLGQCDKTIKNFYKGIELNPNFSPFYK
ncbi:tetratricopeptide repeat protein [Brachyspira pulli]|uniref:tetratricopeptide repeat protein n=1 Tax=Brachyspira pulli TaxID=310721 RepID=UPI0030076D66